MWNRWTAMEGTWTSTGFGIWGGFLQPVLHRHERMSIFLIPLCWNISKQLYFFWSLEISRLLFSGFHPRCEGDVKEKWSILEYMIATIEYIQQPWLKLLCVKKHNTHKVANDRGVSVPHVTGVPRNESGRVRPLGNPCAGEGGWMWMQWESLVQSPKASRGQEGYFRGTQVFLYFS